MVTRCWPARRPTLLSPVGPYVFLQEVRVGRAPSCGLITVCALFALYLRDFRCFPCSYVSSADLQVIDFTFVCGFDLRTLSPGFNYLRTAKSLGNQLAREIARRTPL